MPIRQDVIRFALVAVLATACSARGRYVHKHLNNVGFGLAVGGVACDWGQTHRAASMDWNDRRWREANPVLGAFPSEGTVAAYNVAVIAGLSVGKKFLPQWAQSVLYGATFAVQVETVVGNMERVPGTCGLGGSAH